MQDDDYFVNVEQPFMEEQLLERVLGDECDG